MFRSPWIARVAEQAAQLERAVSLPDFSSPAAADDFRAVCSTPLCLTVLSQEVLELLVRVAIFDLMEISKALVRGCLVAHLPSSPILSNSSLIFPAAMLFRGSLIFFMLLMNTDPLPGGPLTSVLWPFL